MGGNLVLPACVAIVNQVHQPLAAAQAAGVRLPQQLVSRDAGRELEVFRRRFNAAPDCPLDGPDEGDSFAFPGDH